MHLSKPLLRVLEVQQPQLHVAGRRPVAQIPEAGEHPEVLFCCRLPDTEVPRDLLQRSARFHLLIDREEPVDVGIGPPGVMPELKRQFDPVDVCPGTGVREYSHPDVLDTQLAQGCRSGVAVDQDALAGDESRLVLLEVSEALLQRVKILVPLRRVRRFRLQQVLKVLLAVLAPGVLIKSAVKLGVVAALRSDPVSTRVVVERVHRHVDDLYYLRLRTPLDGQGLLKSGAGGYVAETLLHDIPVFGGVRRQAEVSVVLDHSSFSSGWRKV